MKPWCHNRPDREEVGRWVDTGRVSPAGTWRTQKCSGRFWLGMLIHATVLQTRIEKPRPILRYRRAFHDINACMAYAVPEGTVPAPVLSGWRCEGCKHLPKERGGA